MGAHRQFAWADADEELARRALTDPLTHLPNRALLHDRLSQALARVGREKTTVAVMFLDIDRFKLVNDALGHDAGDKLLVTIGARLTEAVRPTDTVARVGGDEFVVVAEDIADLATIIAFGQRLVEAVGAPLQLDASTVWPSVSIGIALTSDSAHNPSSLLRDADLAMYRAKADRCGYAHFTSGADDGARDFPTLVGGSRYPLRVATA